MKNFNWNAERHFNPEFSSNEHEKITNAVANNDL
jgi:hypothetical protein